MTPLDDLSKSISLVDEVYSILDDQKNDSNRIGYVLKSSPKYSYLIIGDLHGDYYSLKQLLTMVDIRKRLEDKSNKVVFLGDYIDRGPKQLETLESVLNLFKSNPDQVILLRGNHEGPADMPAFPNDFGKSIALRFSEDVSLYLEKTQRLFDRLLLGVLIKDRALLIHGGIPSKAQGLEDIAYAPQRSYLREVLWNDPKPDDGTLASNRGIPFGPELTNRFLDSIGVESLIRGHQAPLLGYKIDQGRILTLFSSTNPTHSPRIGSYINCRKAAVLTGKNHSYKIQDLVKDLILF